MREDADALPQRGPVEKTNYGGQASAKESPRLFRP